MKKELFVANLPEDISEETLREIFKPAGDIESIVFEPNPILQGVSALVTMVTEKAATRARNSLNGQIAGDRRIAVSLPDLGDRDRLSDKQQKVVEQIAAILGESDEIPMRQLTAIVMLCGTNFAEAILQEAEMVETGEGIPTVEGDRRRTKGGVFFFLARHRMAKPIRVVIYNRKGRLPDKPDEPPAQASTNG